MLDKIRELGQSAKNVFIFLVTPLLAILGYVVYLGRKNNTLIDDLAKANTEKNLAKALEKAEGAKNDADKEVDYYHAIRDQYLLQQSADEQSKAGTKPSTESDPENKS